MVDRDPEPLGRRPVQRRQQQVQVDAERVHHRHLARPGPDDPRERRPQVVGGVEPARLPPALDRERRPLVDAAGDGVAGGERLQAERVAGEVDLGRQREPVARGGGIAAVVHRRPKIQSRHGRHASRDRLRPGHRRCHRPAARRRQPGAVARGRHRRRRQQRPRPHGAERAAHPRARRARRHPGQRRRRRGRWCGRSSSARPRCTAPTGSATPGSAIRRAASTAATPPTCSARSTASRWSRSARSPTSRWRSRAGPTRCAASGGWCGWAARSAAATSRRPRSSTPGGIRRRRRACCRPGSSS